jgi:glycosyltransferase involved in cell wall biosynthesis
MPVFSVITPLYNKQDLIAQTLQTALAQTFTDFEIIVVDDGSTDGSAAIVQSFKDPRISYIKTENRGVSPARNTGIKAAKGSIIAFLDADDLWAPHHLEAIYSLHMQHPEAGMLCSRYIIRIGKGKIQHPYFIGVPHNYTGIVNNHFGASLINRLAVTSAVAVRANVFKVSGLFDENVTHPEDTDLWIRIGIHFPVAITAVTTMTYNFDLPQSWSRKKMKARKIMDFNKYLSHEAANPGLKQFIDVYRVEYALKYRIEGDLENSQWLYRATNPDNIRFKTKVLFALPPFVLRSMLALKHWLHKKGIGISVYS